MRPSPLLIGLSTGVLAAAVLVGLWSLRDAPTSAGAAVPPRAGATHTAAEPVTVVPAGDPPPVARDEQPDPTAAADFVAALDPAPAEATVVDLTGDGQAEVLVGWLDGGQVVIEVAAWDGGGYQQVYRAPGGIADELVGLQVIDTDGRADTVEIESVQTVGTAGESLSLWAHRDGTFVPIVAVGGCWDGHHTYGIIGASIQGELLTATCDRSPDPRETWPADVYRWDADADTYVHDSSVRRG